MCFIFLLLFAASCGNQGEDPTDEPGDQTEQEPAACEDECGQAQMLRCSADGRRVQICAQNESGCLVWNSEAFCPDNAWCDASVEPAECACLAGYAGDECADCAPGYHSGGAGTCMADETCQAHTCNDNGTCDDSGGTPICDCNIGYAGENCATCAPGYHDDASGACVTDEACQAQTCNGNGACDDAGGIVLCDCDPGYAGDFCGRCDTGYEMDDSGVCMLEEPVVEDGGLAPGPDSLNLCLDEGPEGSSGRSLHVGSGQAYSSINAAIAAANPGDTIYIHQGRYNGHVNIDRGGES